MDHPILPWALAFPPSHVCQFSNQPRNFATNRRKLEPTTEKSKPTPIFFDSLKKVRCTPSSNPCFFSQSETCFFFSIFPNHKNPRPGSPRTWAPRPLHEGRGVKNHVSQSLKRDPSQKGKDPLNRATWLSGATNIC